MMARRRSHTGRSIGPRCFLYTLGAVSVAALCSLATCRTAAVYREVLLRRRFAAATTPLDPAVAANLCRTLSIPEGDRVCTRDGIVYAPDFFPAVRSRSCPASVPMMMCTERSGRTSTIAPS